MQAARLGLTKKGFAPSQCPPQHDQPEREHEPGKGLDGGTPFGPRRKIKLRRHPAAIKMHEGGTVVFNQRHGAASPESEREQRNHHPATHHQQQAWRTPCRVNHGQQNQCDTEREGGGQATRQRCHA